MRHGTCFRRRFAAHHAGAAPHSAVAELGVVRPLRNHTNSMKHLLLLFPCVFLLVGCRTLDYTQGHPNICEVHHVAMFKRAVLFAHGMVPMGRVEGEGLEWRRRMDLYPHPGDCEPATDIVMPDQSGRVVVYVCKQCEAAKKEMEGLPVLGD